MKPRVVFSINHFGHGGAQRQLVRLLPRLTNSYEIHLFVLQTPVGGYDLTNALPSTVTVHQFAFRRLWSSRQWYRVYKALRKVRPAIVVSSLFMSNCVLRILGRWQGIPVISREHNTTVNRRRYHRWLERILARNHEPIIAVSDEVADAVSADLGIDRSRYQVIQNGIDLVEIDTVAQDCTKVQEWKKKLRLTGEVKVALSVGRLVGQKRIDVLLEGFARFVATNQSWRLVIVGEGSERLALEDQAQKLGITEYVRFVGQQPSPHAFFQMADCLVSTSTQEGMSNVHLEALAHGVPLISTPTGGTSAIIVQGETGLIISGSTSQAVTAALVQFTEEGDTDWRGNCLRHRERFSIMHTTKQYIALLQSYIAEK